MKKIVLGLLALAMVFSVVSPVVAQAKKPLKIAEDRICIYRTTWRHGMDL